MILEAEVLRLEIAVGRALIYICEADKAARENAGMKSKPPSKESIRLGVAKKNRKLYDDATTVSSIVKIKKLGWINSEYIPTKDGWRAYAMLDAHREGGAAHFFRVSSSPNYDPEAPETRPVPQGTAERMTWPAIPVSLNSGTW